MYSRYGWEDFLLGSAVGLTLFLTIVGLIAVAWGVAKAIGLVLRAFVLEPRNKVLLVVGTLLVLFTTLALLWGGQSPAFDALAVMSGLALLLVAKVIEIKHEQLFLQPVTGDSFTQALLHEPWWSLEAPVSTNGHLQPAAVSNGSH